MIILDKSGKIVFGLMAALIHEVGHIFAMHLKNCFPKEIIAGLFDVNIKDLSVNQRTYKDDIMINLFGPIFNLVFCFVFYIIYFFTGNSNFFLASSENFALFIFNILPIETLDGGQILFSILAPIKGVKFSIHCVEIISFLILFPIAVLGFYILITSRYNFSLLFFSCYLMVMLLIKKSKLLS